LFGVHTTLQPFRLPGATHKLGPLNETRNLPLGESPNAAAVLERMQDDAFETTHRRDAPLQPSRYFAAREIHDLGPTILTLPVPRRAGATPLKPGLTQGQMVPPPWAAFGVGGQLENFRRRPRATFPPATCGHGSLPTHHDRSRRLLRFPHHRSHSQSQEG